MVKFYKFAKLPVGTVTFNDIHDHWKPIVKMQGGVAIKVSAKEMGECL